MKEARIDTANTVGQLAGNFPGTVPAGMKKARIVIASTVGQLAGKCLQERKMQGVL
jgi:hypothetical protein